MSTDSSTKHPFALSGQAETGNGVVPAKTTGAEGPGQSKAPHLVPKNLDTSKFTASTLLVGAATLVLVCVGLIVLLATAAPQITIAVVAVIVLGMVGVLTTLLRMTHDDEPEPTARARSSKIGTASENNLVEKERETKS